MKTHQKGGKSTTKTNQTELPKSERKKNHPRNPQIFTQDRKFLILSRKMR